MCYLVYLSTDDDTDLRVHNSPLVAFDRNLDRGEKAPLGILQFAHRWYVGSATGCSCAFRQLISIELGFDVPQDWCPEDPDNIEATKQFYDVVAELVGLGRLVDCMSWWVRTPEDNVIRMNVDLASVSRDHFRFFENHHFVFCDSRKVT
jgi:hypothetical protein